MNYLVVQDWKNTHGNHAGMVHMCKLLEQLHPNQYKVLIKNQPNLFVSEKSPWGQIKRIWNHFIAKPYYLKHTFPKECMNLCSSMFNTLKPGDRVFLLEYLSEATPQLQLANYIRVNFPKVKICTLSHLTVDYFKNCQSSNREYFEKWSAPVDKMLTLGTSLSSYFEKQGISKDKISTGFHYVDAAYYHKNESMEIHHPLRIIAMGSLQRDYSMLADIVKGVPEAQFIICHGRTDVDNLFDGCNNVILKGYLSEDELKYQMDIADVSINIMIDTVGSNVITTSMAMGLAILASNVGSIGDYCKDTNSILCENTKNSFIRAIKILSRDSNRVLKMRESSIELSQRLHIENVHKWFSSL